MKFTKEQITLVKFLDTYTQAIVKRFGLLYEQAEDTSFGWDSVAESSPEVFTQALALAMEFTKLQMDSNLC